MSNLIPKSDSCENCIHEPICILKKEFEQITNKTKTVITDLQKQDVFYLSHHCMHYKRKEDEVLFRKRKDGVECTK